MYTTTTKYKRLVDSDVRPIDWRVSISFTKQQSGATSFFEIGTSLIQDGGDYIKPLEDVSIQLWDQYDYIDYSSRVINIEWTKQTENIASVTTAYADIVFDNHDDFFTTGSGSAIDGFILPFRPIRILAGFGNELIPSFVGVTSSVPEIDTKNKTAKFHCNDMLSTLLEKPLDETLLLIDKRTDEILTTMFTSLGIEESQLDFDIGEVTIPYAYFLRGETIKDGLIKLMEAEQGRFFLTESGTLTFRNRQSYIQDRVKRFDEYHNIIDLSTRKERDITNVVIVKGKTRELMANASYWELTSATKINAGSSIDIWANFTDPVSTVDDPVYIDDAVTSSFTVMTQASGGVANSTDVTLTSSSTFGASFKMTFANSGVSDLYITNIDLWAVVAQVVNEIYNRTENTDSINIYGEQILTIENDFFQSEDLATYQSNLILTGNGEYNSALEMIVRGDASLQIDDTVEIIAGNTIADYKVTKIVNKMENPAKYTQVVRVKNYYPVIFFTIGVSLIEGTDRIKPNL